ncbi:hypothetical protein IKP85_04850 [bacterium]|nr:hypothetical protein [bacterium]
MINQINSYCINNKTKRPILGNSAAPTVQTPNAADRFILELEVNNKKEKNGNFLSRYFWSPTALLVSALPVLVYEYATLFRMKNLKKQCRKKDATLIYNLFKKNFKFALAGAIASYAGLEYFFNSRNDKNYKKLEENFKKLNTSTDAKLAGTFRSTYMGAYCNSPSGNIVINRNLLNDPLMSRSLKKLIKHELVHARQFETIARSKDGIKKLNYANVKQAAKIIEGNPVILEDFRQVYKAVQEDKSGKYNGKIIHIQSETYDMKKYIESLNIVINNKNATYNDIPMIIDEEHYKKVIAQKGALTPEEEKKAEEYFKALSDYSPVSAFDAYNPFGSYRNNALEKEAYQENPSLLMKLFGKK